MILTYDGNKEYFYIMILTDEETSQYGLPHSKINVILVVLNLGNVFKNANYQHGTPIK